MESTCLLSCANSIPTLFNVKQTNGAYIMITIHVYSIYFAGLCRTSEIFGVSEYVIGNLKYVKAHEFESLSVTAHKWIPITEVGTGS